MGVRRRYVDGSVTSSYYVHNIQYGFLFDSPGHDVTSVEFHGTKCHFLSREQKPTAAVVVGRNFTKADRI